MVTAGELTKFGVAFNGNQGSVTRVGNQGSVTLIYGDRKKRRQRTKKPCALGAAQGASPDKRFRGGTGGQPRQER